MAIILFGVFVFDVSIKRLQDYIKLKPIPLALLQKLYDQSEDEPFIEIFEITEKHASTLEKYIADENEKINFKRYDYFLETHQE